MFEPSAEETYNRRKSSQKKILMDNFLPEGLEVQELSLFGPRHIEMEKRQQILRILQTISKTCPKNYIGNRLKYFFLFQQIQSNYEASTSDISHHKHKLTPEYRYHNKDKFNIHCQNILHWITYQSLIFLLNLRIQSGLPKQRRKK